MRINVNSRDMETDQEELHYPDILKLAGYEPYREDGTLRVISVTYQAKNEEGWEKSGIIAPNMSVRVYEGMILNAYDTSNA